MSEDTLSPLQSYQKHQYQTSLKDEEEAQKKNVRKSDEKTIKEKVDMEDQGHKSYRENLNDPNCTLKITTCFCSFSLPLSLFSRRDNASREGEHLSASKCEKPQVHFE